MVDLQQLPDIEKTDSKVEVSCLKWTFSNGRRKVCVNFQTDTQQMNIADYRYRNSLYLNDNEVDLKFTEHQSLLTKRVYLLSYIDIYSTSGSLYWMIQLFIIERDSDKNGCSPSNKHFPIRRGTEIDI